MFLIPACLINATAIHADGPTPEQTGNVNKALFDLSGDRVYLAGDKGVQVWNWKQNTLEQTLTSKPCNVMTQAADGRVAFASNSKEFSIYDPRQSTMELVNLDGLGAVISSLSFTGDGKNILIGSTVTKAAWYSPSSEPGGSPRTDYFPQNSFGETAVVAGQTKEQPFYCGSILGWVSQFKTTPFGVHFDKEWKSHTEKIAEMVISPDGKHLVTAGANGAIYYRNTDTGQSISSTENQQFDLATRSFNAPSLALSADGASLLSAGGHKVILWDLQTMQKAKQFQVPNVKQAALSRDGKYFVAVTTDRRVMIFDLATGEIVAEIGGQSSIFASKPQLLKDVATGPSTVGNLDVQNITAFPEKKRVIVSTSNGLIVLDDSGPQTKVEATLPFVSTPSKMKQAEDGKHYFRADDGAHGSELYETDGTPEGTKMVADLAPGADSGAISSDPRDSALMPNIYVDPHSIYTFRAPYPGDPEPDKAALVQIQLGGKVTVIAKFKYPPMPRDLINHAGILYFNAADAKGTRQFWRSDGTPEGTRIVKFINPNENRDSLYEKSFLTTGVSNASGTPTEVLYFSATDGTAWGLYQSDGTEAGTSKVKSFSQSYPPLQSTKTPKGQVFIAHDGTTGYEPYITDGTEAGTKKLADLTTSPMGVAGNFPESYNPQFTHLTDGEGKFKGALFTGYNNAGNDSLYVTDGTPEGTKTLFSPSSYQDSVKGLTGNQSQAFYSQGSKLYKTDGTSAGTLVKQFPGGYGKNPVSNLTMNGDDVLYSADDGAHGTEVWKTKPPHNAESSAMTVDAAKDKQPGSKWESNPANPGLTGDNPLLPLVAFTQTYHNAAANLVFDSDAKLWKSFFQKSDGTPKGTQPFMEKPPKSSKQNLKIPSASSITAAADGDEIEPFTFDSIKSALFLDHRMIFVANDGVSGLEPWAADGTPTGTLLLKDVCSFNAQSPYQYIEGARFLTRFKDKIFFAGADCPSAAEWAEHLWETDGTTTGTRAVETQRYKNPRDLCVAGDTLFFCAYDILDGNYRWELFKSDGTAEGTTIVCDINPGTRSSQPQLITACGDRVFFTAYRDDVGRELWVSDGTWDGTHLVKDIIPESLDATGYDRNARIGNLIALNGLMFFTADDGTSGTELWRSDGTEAGTWMVKDIWPGAGASDPKLLTVVSGPSAYETPEGELIVPGDVLYFSASSPGHGRELWKTDGTPEGTALVRDIVPGIGSSLPYWITPVALEPGMAFFSAQTPEAGRELWITDGTESGTRLFADINPGSDSSDPSQMVARLMASAMDSVLFLMADDGVHGAEPWVLNPALPEPTPTPTPNPDAWMVQ